MGQAYVSRARALVGTPFRAQGRCISRGLDCVGLVVAAYQLDEAGLRADYRLRGEHLGELKAAIGVAFRRVSRRAARAGDLLLYRAGEGQYHLAVMTGQGIVHADAGLKRVVERPGMVPWPLLAVYRRRVRNKKAG